MPSPKADPLVVTTLRNFRVALGLREDALVADLAGQWLQIENRLDADISLLAREMADLVASGKPITEQLVWRQQRYQYLKAQMKEELSRFNVATVSTISQAQGQYATLGINAAQAAITTQIGPFGTNWNRINVGAVESMIGFAGDGSPLRSLLAEDYPDAVDGLLKALINGVARGQSPVQTAREMKDGMAGGLDRALVIARTETARAYRMASTEQYRQSGVVRGFRRLVFRQTACLSCLMLDGELFDVASEMDDHPNGKAELPGNVIDCPSPDTLVTLWHDGDVVVIRTASGKFLATTEHHPILTRRGWVAAAFVQEGDDVVSASGIQWAPGVVRPDKHHMPAKVENLASAFDMFRLGRVPESAKHLYGNGVDGKVDVVFVNRLFWDSLDAGAQKQVRKRLGVLGADREASSLYRGGDIAPVRLGLPFASAPFLGIQHDALAFGLGQMAGSQGGGFAHASMMDSVLSQNAGDNGTGNPIGAGNGKLGLARNVTGAHVGGDASSLIPDANGYFADLDRRSFGFVPEEPLGLEQIRESLFGGVPAKGSGVGAVSGEIVFDRVVDVGVRRFAGHVYGLQTQNGWYSTNGIIAHNCAVVPMVNGVADPTWETGKQWFGKLTPEEQEAKMGPGMFAAWKDGKFTLDDLGQKQHSDTWGDSPRVPSLGELEGEKAETLSFGSATMSTVDETSVTGRLWTQGEGRPFTAAETAKVNEAVVSLHESGGLIPSKITLLTGAGEENIGGLYMGKGEVGVASGFLQGTGLTYIGGRPGILAHEVGHAVQENLTKKEAAAWEELWARLPKAGPGIDYLETHPSFESQRGWVEDVADAYRVLLGIGEERGYLGPVRTGILRNAVKRMQKSKTW